MPQCAKTLKIGSVLLKTGVFKVKNLPNSSKAEKILLFWRNCKKLLNYLFAILSVPAYYFFLIILLAERLTAFTPWLPIFSLPQSI